MKYKISDIASIAGVSKATVSNALNRKRGIGADTRKMILKIANEIGYYKEVSKSNITKTIRLIIFKRHGYVVSDTPFFSSLIEGIEKECRTQGYEMLISHVNKSDEDYKEIINNINYDYSSGLLILATEMYREDLEFLNNGNSPVVILDSNFKGMNFDSVLINNSDAAYKATSYLIENGHVNIGYLHSSVYINNFYHRKSGYLESLSEHGLKSDKKAQIALEPTMEGSYRDMKRILEQNEIDLPTAFFADNDIIAFGAMRAFKEKGIKIPRDISIIGFDDMPFCEITSPRLTTIRVFKQEMGSVAVKRLLQKLDGDNGVQVKVELGTELILRDSVLKIT